MDKMKNNLLARVGGGILIFSFLCLAFLEYHRIIPEAELFDKGNYFDYSILLYLSTWIIYILVFLAGTFVFFKSIKANLFLFLFAVTTLLEVYFNQYIYIIKSLSDYPFYILFGLSMLSLITALFNFLNTEKITFIEILLSFILALLIVYLPNALITFYF